jgi:putative heme-binding domain-containing protein
MKDVRMHRVAAIWFFAFTAIACAADHVVHGRTFSLPEGFVIERVAGPPLVKHPVHAAFDDKGRLLVTEVSGSNAPIKEQLKTLEHKVLRLTDDNGDGVFDRSEVWAKDLPMPQGILWYKGSAYVAAPPAIWKLQSKPDDSGSLPKTAWYDPKTATGCNNDIHGPWLGPDGWFYWTKGAFAEQTHELVNGKRLTTKASMLLRRRPEGGPVDVLMTGGMDNPVGLAFLHNGDRIVSGTFLHHPGGGLRDGMIHALYGGVYGKDHDVLNGLPRTGDLLPVMTELGPAAPSSVIRYDGFWFTDELGDQLLLCQFNLHKVSRHCVIPDGATYKTRNSDFLSSKDLDFHPTDVLEDPPDENLNGSLLVVDTGGWYKLCCPTSQLAKPEVPGAIYRIRRKEKSLLRSLLEFKPRPPPPNALTDLPKALERIDENPYVRRNAIERLRLRKKLPEDASTLLQMAANERDRALTHAIRYALWELDSPDLVEQLAGEPGRSPLSIAAALWAVSQNPKWQAKRFTVDRLLSWAEHSEPELAAAARFALQQRKEFAERGVNWLRERLGGKPRTDAGWEALRPLLAAWLGRADLQNLLAGWCESPDVRVRIYCWSLMNDLPGKMVPAIWMQAAIKRLSDGSADEIAAILKLVQRSPLKDAALREAIQRRSGDRTLAAELRFSLIAMAPPKETTEASFKELLDALSSDQSFTLRGAAAEALGKSKLSEAQLTALAKALKECGPLEIDRLLPAFTATPTPSVGETLIAALMNAKARKALQVEDLKKRLAAFGPALKPAADKLFAKFAEDRATETKRLEQLLATLPKGDVKRGLQVFDGTKASCRACHKLGYVGGDLAPELSKIGAIRSRRDLLEAIVFPSASFVRSYEPTQFLLKDGRSINGLVRKETASDILLQTGVNKEERIAKADIESRQTSTVSVMPAGMEQQLSPQELADLLEFLQSMK